MEAGYRSFVCAEVQVAVQTRRGFTLLNRIIPAWMIGTTGAILILAATGINSVVTPNLDAAVEEQERKSAKLDSEAKNMWLSHARADDLENAAKRQLAICSETRHSNLSSCLVNVYDLYMAAILNMLAASGRDDIDDPAHEERAHSLLRALDADDTTNLSEVTGWISELRLQSQAGINLRRKNIKTLKETIDDDRRNRQIITLFWFPILNLTGLFLVLLSNLPIWRSPKKSPAQG